MNEKDVSLYIPHDVIVKESSNSFLKNLIITQIGYFDKAYDHFIRREGIEEYILLYCIAGKGFAEIDGKNILICKGDLVFFHKDLPHAYGADNNNPWSIQWVHFRGIGVPDLFKVSDISVLSPILHIGENSTVITFIETAIKTLSNGYSFPNLFYASTCFQELFCFLIKLKMNSGFQNSNDIDVENVINFMIKNINTVFSLSDFAAYAKISKYHFVRSFKEKTGYSPIHYFNRLKIQKACELLLTSTNNIKEISDLLSFNNPFYFSEVFKKVTGYSPSSYKRAHRQN
jgi:AraC family transcriptional regulator, arabinose operon regulatory protein